MNIKFKDIIVIGFALFAMFFGAGNLIFPPYLGVVSGQKWFISFLSFLFADGGLALLGVIALTRTNGDMKKLFTRAGTGIGILIGTIMILCIGPFLAIPRTAATTFEIGIVPIFGTAINSIVFSIVFFAISLLLSIRPSKVVDIVGSFLTPALLICLIVLIVKGIISPIGAPIDRVLVDNVVVSGILEGYQTMDGLAACIFAGIVIASVTQKGYTEKSVMVKATILAGIVAVVGMAIIYGGLTYLGASVSSQFGADAERTGLVVYITSAILGSTGKIIIAIIVALACLTTSIGLTTACGNYFKELSNGKIKYEVTVVVVSVFSAVVSNFGVNQIIKLAVPLLLMVYPAVVTYIILGLLNDVIKNNNVFRLGIWCALILGILSVLPSIKLFENIKLLVAIADNMSTWPGHQFGFFWILPVIVLSVIGFFIPSKNIKN